MGGLNMFTGLVQKIGTVKRISRGSGLVLEIAFEPWVKELEKGESVAVNGVCLTVVDFNRSRFTADVLKETEERSTLGSLLPGAKVYLERALRAGEPLGGHIVQGHVDSKGVIVAKEPRGRDFRLKIRCSRILAASSVLKGSITVDGVSLTITQIGDDFLSVDIIPTTASETTLGTKRPGDSVNLEGDVIGKYVSAAVKKSTLTEDKLRMAGFLD
jgi:riboflavin synthase